MKKSLTHLPPEKRAELETIVTKIREEFDGVLMIILFGSYARGDWRDEAYEYRERGERVFYEYRSDYDLAVIVQGGKISRDRQRFGLFASRLEQTNPGIAPISLFSYQADHFNYQLSIGDDFFSEIKKEGIKLYDSKKLKLAKARRLKPEERRKIAEEDFKEWFKSAREFFEDYQSNYEKRRCKKAAFELHQAVERLFHTVSKVYTRDRRRTHNIEKLGRQVASLDSRFLGIFPRATKQEEDCYQLLKAAYIDARYNPEYKITKKQLAHLATYVKKLQTLTRKACREKIKSFTTK